MVLLIWFLYQERVEELGSLPNVGSLLRYVHTYIHTIVFVWNLIGWSLLWLTSLCPVSVVTPPYSCLWLCSISPSRISGSSTPRFLTHIFLVLLLETLSIIILFPYILISFLFSGFETVTYMLEVHMVTFNLKLNCACCLRPKPIYLFMDSREASLTKILLGTRVQ